MLWEGVDEESLSGSYCSFNRPEGHIGHILNNAHIKQCYPQPSFIVLNILFIADEDYFRQFATFSAKLHDELTLFCRN